MKERIKKIRKTAELTQIEFGERLGVKGNTITGYESGSRSPSDAVIMSICREFNVDEHWLRTGEGEMFRQLSRSEELSAFFGDLLADTPDFRHSLLTVLARMTPDEWALLEKKAWELVEELQKNGHA